MERKPLTYKDIALSAEKLGEIIEPTIYPIFDTIETVMLKVPFLKILPSNLRDGESHISLEPGSVIYDKYSHSIFVSKTNYGLLNTNWDIMKNLHITAVVDIQFPKKFKTFIYKQWII